MSWLGFIPARGGSKRIPGKNLREICGTPLIAWTIEAALDSGQFDQIVVSSDDDGVLEIARNCGVVAERRADALAGDNARAVEVVRDYIGRLDVQRRFDHVAMMLPTCPFRTADDIRHAVALYDERDTDFVIGMCEYDFPPGLALERSADGTRFRMLDPDQYSRTTRSQDCGKAYHPNGAIYIAAIEALLREGTFFVDPVVGYVMPPERSFDIDEPYQLAIAELMMKHLLEVRTCET